MVTEQEDLELELVAKVGDGELPIDLGLLRGTAEAAIEDAHSIAPTATAPAATSAAAALVPPSPLARLFLFSLTIRDVRSGNEADRPTVWDQGKYGPRRGRRLVRGDGWKLVWTCYQSLMRSLFRSDTKKKEEDRRKKVGPKKRKKSETARYQKKRTKRLGSSSSVRIIKTT